MKILSMNYFILFGLATKIAYQHSIQNVITELQTTFQDKMSFYKIDVFL